MVSEIPAVTPSIFRSVKHLVPSTASIEFYPMIGNIVEEFFVRLNYIAFVR